MLRELVVQDLGVIERAEIELDVGSSALTGETGAGKTLLVSAMALVLGDRADRGLVRHGAKSARVEARFEVGVDHPAAALLRERDLIDDATTDIVVSRVISDGGGKVRVNGRVATVGLLGELGPLLVEIAGQHEHQRLGSRREQMQLLDSFAGPEAVELSARVAEMVRGAAATRRRAEELAAGERDTERELDVLRYEISEIEATGVRQGESAELQAEADRLEHAEAIGAAIADARSSLESEGGGVDSVRAAADGIARVASRDPELGPLVQRLGSAAIELDDIAAELARRVPAIDDAALDGIRERLATVARLQRKYGEDEAGILGYLATAKVRADELQSGAFDAGETRARAQEQQDAARAEATRLTRMRAEAAARLGAEVEAILGRLAMADTKVEIALEPADLYEGGLETVEMRIASPGHPPRPIVKIASGGELSRIALALRLASGRAAGSAPTLIFDEVDAGVGGEAARSVGRCLADLAREAGSQVLVVTHLPQVAAFADSHLHVKKVSSGAAATAVVEHLSDEGRVAELSRMLAGLPGSERAREHAQELLEIAAAS